MFGIIGYIALIVYAGGLFTWAVARGRDSAAVGILLGISGLQLAVLQTIHPSLGWFVAVSGLLIGARDVFMTFRRNSHLIPAMAHSPIDRADETA